MNEENNVLTIKTVQIQPIRNMITAIKDVLTDATITYTDNGLKIINFDICNLLFFCLTRSQILRKIF